MASRATTTVPVVLIFLLTPFQRSGLATVIESASTIIVQASDLITKITVMCPKSFSFFFEGSPLTL
jgi:hypothetical protein